ncbi:MAG: sulfatase [Armatimonadetes bacterium]|nr:sulfatase [Armatimonadota bacterium]
MNVLLISCDSLRADHLGCYGYPRATSPRLDAFAQDAVLGEWMLCPTLPTTPVHTTMMTGWHSLTHGLVSHRGGLAPRAGYPWLPSILQQAGYTTAAVDNIRRLLGWFADGFEYYIDPAHRHGHIWTASTETLNQRTLPWLREHRDEPFFLFLHVWDTHTPYLPPLPLRNRFYEGDPCDPRHTSMERFRRQFFYVRSEQWLAQLCEDLGQSGPLTDTEYLVSLYDSCILHMDEHLGRLFDALDELGLSEDTLVILVGDHGEMMGENDVFFDHHSLYEGNLHVPLLVRWPAGGLSGGRRVAPMVQHLDLAPTILAAAGQPVPESMEGHNLLPLLRGESSAPVHKQLITQECTWQASWAIRTETHKLIIARDQGLHNQPPREFYDLANDPRETRNLYLEQWPLAEELEARLEGWIARKLDALGLAEDPVRHENISLGRRWYDWLEAKKPARQRGA